MNRSLMATGLLTLAGAYALLKVAEPYFNNWGATKEEQSQPIPGDDVLGGAEIETTQAITVNTKPEAIWPWLIQVGQGRGGFYSYSFLENLLGSKIKNVSLLIPELQNLREGDSVRLHPKATPLKIVKLIPNRVLAIEGWVFYLKPFGDNQTRFIARTYKVPIGPEFGPVAYFIFGSVGWHLAHFIMQQKMFRTIKALAEKHGAVEEERRAEIYF